VVPVSPPFLFTGSPGMARRGLLQNTDRSFPDTAALPKWAAGLFAIDSSSEGVDDVEDGFDIVASLANGEWAIGDQSGECGALHVGTGL
jgi:hypothetical protein